MKAKTTRRALLMSALSLLLCVSMLVGTTFAWFTDSVTSAGNIIQSGTLDVEMQWAKGTEDPASAAWTDASTGPIFNYDLWEPGYVEVRHIQIKNAGTLGLKYQLAIEANGEVSELADVIDVYYLDPAQQINLRTQLTETMKLGTLSEVLEVINTTASGELLPGESDTITLALKMQETAGNEYQGLAIGSDFSIKLVATQLTYEVDSFDKYYDAAATPWNGAVDYSWYNDTDSEFIIYTPAELAGFAAIVNGTADGIAIDGFVGKTVKLGADINLGNLNWTPIGDVDADDYVGFQGIFDGQDKTIYNLKIESNSWGQGLFGYMTKHGTIKNVKVHNAFVSADDTSGVIAGYATRGTFSNIHVSGNINVTGKQHMGGIVGNGYYANFENCSVAGATGSSITATTGSFVGGIVGYHGEGNLSIKDCAVKNIEISGYTFVGGITGLASAGNIISGCAVENVTLTKTRDGSNASIGFVSGSFTYNASSAVTINDCTVKNSSLNGNYEKRNTSEESLLYGFEYSAQTGTNFQMSGNTTANCEDNLVLLVKYTSVKNETELKTALNAGENVILENDIEVYSTINFNGAIIDGNGKRLIFMASGSGQVCLNPTGGTIKNLTITDPNANMFDNKWAIGSMQMVDTTLTENLYLENVTISNFHTVLDMKANGNSIFVKNSEIHNWMQINGAEIVSFDGCHFIADAAAQMTFNQPSSKQAIIFLMGDMSFANCHFEEDVNFYLDTNRYSGNVYFENSTYGNNGVENRPIDSFGFIKYWFPATGVYGYAGTFGDTKPAQTHFNWYIDNVMVWDATAI